MLKKSSSRLCLLTSETLEKAESGFLMKLCENAEDLLDLRDSGVSSSAVFKLEELKVCLVNFRRRR